MKIGPYRIGSHFLLAPMAGVTDAPFRKLCRHFGAGLATSEMTTSDIDLWRTAKSKHRLTIDDDVEPRSVQIAGSEADKIALAAQVCVDRGAQIIDINMGCPAKKVCRKLAGSALLRDERLVQRILEATVKAVDVPVTLKIRTGWDTEHRNGVQVAQIAEASGIQALAVHGRTRACKYRGQAEYDTIARIKKSVSIPVIANGDIATVEKSLEVMNVTSADAVMIGRGAQGRPWLFREFTHFYETGKKIAPLEICQVRDIILDHLRDLYRFYGETTGVRVARKHLSWYCAQLEEAASFRHKVVRVETASEQMRLTRNYFARRRGTDPIAA
ncbi:MAG: tRNA dihydrouridine synthase DusB [Pseudomonadota bacterium]